MASSQAINQFNERWRSSPEYARILQQVGARPGQLLSDQQRQQVQGLVEQAFGMKFPKGVEIDPAGNMNENEGFGKQAKRWGPIAGGAALAAFGIPGLMSGLLTGGGGGAAAAGGAKAASGAAGGVLPSYGPSAAMQAANMGMGPIGGGLAAGGSLASAAGGLLPSYGPSAAMQTAGATLPAASQVTPTAALGLASAIPGVVGNALGDSGGGGGALKTVLENLMKWGPVGLAGLGAVKGLTQGPTPAEQEMAKLLQLSGSRAQATQPLFEALNRMTLAQLPRYARGGQ